VAARLKGDYARAETWFDAAVSNAQGLKPYEWYFAATSWGWMALEQLDLERAEALARDGLTACRQIGHHTGQAESLRLCACVASSRGEHEGAIRLFAAAARLTHDLRSANALEIPLDRERINELLAASRAAMGEARFNELWHAGQVSALDEAVAYALAD
jgi:hypothetical protein